MDHFSIIFFLFFVFLYRDLETIFTYPPQCFKSQQAFLNKTLMIRQVFHGPHYNLITASSRFNISANPNMPKSFLSIALHSKTEKMSTSVSTLRNLP